MYSKALALRNVGRATARLHRLGPCPWQTSIPRPTTPVKATAGTIGSASQKREVSDIQRHRDYAAMEAKYGTFWCPKTMDEKIVAAARPPPGHKYWGLTIFRCTYKDDEAWSQLTKLITEHVHESAEGYEAPYMIESFNLKVFEDPSVLEGASTTLLRMKFLEWMAGAAIEQETEEIDGGHPLLLPDVRGGLHGSKQRYQFCVQVDEDSLYSIIDRDTKAPIAPGRGHVNLINAEWKLPDPEEWRKWNEMDAEDGYPLDEDEGPLDEDEEPIEGCRMIDVGWMKTHLSVFGVGAQTYLDDTSWGINYVRPPGIAHIF